MKVNQTKIKDSFQVLTMVDRPNWLKICSNILIIIFILTICILAFIPWQQTSRGEGQVTAIDPANRVQELYAPVSGQINEWHVVEGSSVKRGDPIVEIIDNDPNFLQRLESERDAVLQQYDAARISTKTALNNYKRQQKLFKEGLSSKMDEEKALITYKKNLVDEAKISAKLTQAEVKLSQQQNQVIRAPRDGTILRVRPGTGAVFLKKGDYVVTFVPETSKPATEIFINGNDLPLVYPGRHVRLQFEGWPAVQFSGWPSVAVGTFGGRVFSVDPSVQQNGKFRVLIEPTEEEPWPDMTYLRQGTRAYGWILLDTVKIGYELWRQLNGFPPSIESNPYVTNSKNGEKKSGQK